MAPGYYNFLSFRMDGTENLYISLSFPKHILKVLSLKLLLTFNIRAAHPYSSGLRLREGGVTVIISWTGIRHWQSVVAPKISKIPRTLTWSFHFFILRKPVEICSVFLSTHPLAHIISIFSPFPIILRTLIYTDVTKYAHSILAKYVLILLDKTLRMRLTFLRPKSLDTRLG